MTPTRPRSTPSWSAAGWPARASTPPSWSPPGRVRVRGRGRRQAGHPGRPRATPIVVRGGRRTTRLRLPRRAQARRRARRRSSRRAAPSPGGGAWTPARRTGGLHRRAAAPGRRAGGRASTSATASWPGRCSTDDRVRVLDRTNVRDLDPDADRRRRSTSSSATCRSSRCGWCCRPWSRCTAAGRRPGADGEAAVRGGPRAARHGRGRPRPGAAGGGGASRSPSGARRARARGARA